MTSRSQQSLQHFVLTRFNIASAGREAPIRNTPGWLERRFDLFEMYCLPSVAGQTNADFTWLIYFDENTPTEFRKRIEALQADCPFEARYVGLFDTSIAVSDVAERLRPNVERVLTTRLDNDDAISKTYLQDVRKHAEECTEVSIINYPNGLAMVSGRVFSAHDTSNPFASLIEPAAHLKSIWDAPHTELAKRYPVVQVAAEPHWLQVVHAENVTNRIKGKLLAETSVQQHFALSNKVPIHRATKWELAIDRTVFAPVRALREHAIVLAKKLLRRGARH